MKDPGRYHSLAKRKLVEPDALLSYREIFRLYNIQIILLSDGTQVTEAIVHLLHSAGLDPLFFPLMLVSMTLKTNVK